MHCRAMTRGAAKKEAARREAAEAPDSKAQKQARLEAACAGPRAQSCSRSNATAPATMSVLQRHYRVEQSLRAVQVDDELAEPSNDHMEC